MYYVRWFDPRREFPLRRDFHTSRERNTFLETLPYLYETGKHPRSQTQYRGQPYRQRRNLTKPST